MNKKGFTLIELLGVITLLLLLAALVYTKVSSSVKDTKTDLSQEQYKLLIESARIWGVMNTSKLPQTGNTYNLTINKMIEDEIIKTTSVKDPNTDEIIPGCIVITNDNGKYTYTYSEVCN